MVPARAAAWLRAARACGVLEVRDQIGDARSTLAERSAHALQVPALGVQPDRDRPTEGALDGVDCVGVGRVVDHHTVAWPGQQPQHQRQSMLGAVRDHDLVGGRGQAATGVAIGHGLAEFLEAQCGIAVLGQEGR